MDNNQNQTGKSCSWKNPIVIVSIVAVIDALIVITVFLSWHSGFSPFKIGFLVVAALLNVVLLLKAFMSVSKCDMSNHTGQMHKS